MELSKKMLKMLTVFMLVGVLVLSGCSTEQLKAADVYKKTAEASQKMESFNMDMDMKMNMEAGTEKMDFDTKIAADVIMKPEMQMDMKMDISVLDQKVNMQMVLVKDGFYLKDQTGNWTKLPKEQVDQIMGNSMKEQYDPSAQIEQLKEFADDFSMTETDDAYTLKLTATGDKFKKFMQEEVKKQLSSQQAFSGMTADMPEVTFNKAEYTYVIDKKTYNPKAVDMIMDAEFTIEGEKVHMIMDMKSKYNKINEVKEIKVPEGVK